MTPPTSGSEGRVAPYPYLEQLVVAMRRLPVRDIPPALVDVATRALLAFMGAHGDTIDELDVEAMETLRCWEGQALDRMRRPAPEEPGT